MLFLWECYVISMGIAIGFLSETAIGFLSVFYSGSGAVSVGFPMGFLWNFSGISMGFLFCLYGIALGFLCGFYDISVGFLWIFFVVLTIFLWEV